MTLNARIRRLAWRLGAVLFVRWLALFLFLALCAAIFVAGLDRLVYLGAGAYVVAAVLAGLAVPAAAAAVLLADRPGRLCAARSADAALKLGDRLASAIELGASDDAWARAVADDAERQIHDVRAAEVFPFRATVFARLLIPAVIVMAILLLLPCADLLGRQKAAFRQQAVAAAAAQRTEALVVAAARESLGGGAGTTPPNSAGTVRLTFVQIRKDLLEGKLDSVRRIELSERLRKLSELLSREEGGRELAEQIEKAAVKLAQGGDAAAELRAVEEGLARLEETLAGQETPEGPLPELPSQADLRDQAHPLAAGRLPETDGLVELGPEGRTPEDGAQPFAGIDYAAASAGGSADVSRTYEQADREAEAQIESGAIPARYARLVRGYFDAIKPAEE